MYNFLQIVLFEGQIKRLKAAVDVINTLNLIFEQPRVLEQQFPWNWFTN